MQSLLRPIVLICSELLTICFKPGKAKVMLIKQKLRKRYWLDPKQVSASYIRGGSIEDALDQDDELTLIKNELIDQASVDINNMSDFIIDKNFEDSDNAEHQ